MVGRRYDVVVVGGGLAGVCAAIAAAREGIKVALVHERPVLGGNSSSEMRIPISSAATNGRNRFCVETGIIEELRIENSYVNPDMNFYVWDSILLDWVKRERNLDLFLNTRAKKAIVEGHKIEAVEVEQVFDEKRFTLTAGLFIDCSGDGKIASDSGAHFLMGRESRDEFHEAMAPEVSDHSTLPSSLQFQVKKVDYPVHFIPPLFALKFPRCEDLPFHTKEAMEYADELKPGKALFWWIEWGGHCDVIHDSEKIRNKLVTILLGVWDHYKNHPDHAEKMKNYQLEWICTIPAKRESRRFMGDYILTQNDIEQRRHFPDAVAYGGWIIDLHPCEGFFKLPNRRDDFMTKENQMFVRPYDIPFGCLYSRNIENLMMAGRNISVTHVALGSPRIQGTCAILGQAVGVASALCIRLNVAPRELRSRYIKELQQSLLRQDCYIIGLKNGDPNDVARSASVKASSQAKLRVVKPAAFIPLDIPRAQMIPIDSSRLGTVSLLLESKVEKSISIDLYLQEAGPFEEFDEKNEIIAKGSSIVPPGRNWIDFEFNCSIVEGKCYWIWLPAKQDVAWGYSDEEPMGTRRAYRGSKPSDYSHGTHCFRASPSLFVYSPRNVTNGISRPEQWSNVWISDKTTGFPQWLELDFGEKREINTVYLIFDTNLNRRVGQRGIVPGPMKECIRDYKLVYLKNEKWVEILKEEGNYHRRRIHKFADIRTKKLRLEVLGTNGSKAAHFFEIRVYNA